MSGHENVRDGMNRLETVVEGLVERLQAEPSVAGAFLGGSLAAGRADDFSDVDLAVVAAAGREEEAWGLRGDLAAIPGLPLRTLERSWPGARMVACLYGPQAYPPLGLEVDLAFCALAEVDAPMPYAPSRIVLDRSGGLARAVAAAAPRRAGALGKGRTAMAGATGARALHLEHRLKQVTRTATAPPAPGRPPSGR
jgi:predicted nucleotidyltransferase